MTTADTAQRAARVAGIAYLAIFVLAIVANFFVLEPLVSDSDAVATAANLTAGEAAFRMAVAAFIAVLILDLIIGWALYIVLRPAGPDLSLLALIFRAAYSISHIGVVLGLLSALRFAGVEPALAQGLGAGAPALSYFFITGHSLQFTITLIFFGVHLVVLGALIVRARYIPRLIGGLVALAGLAYALDGFGTILLGSYGERADLAAAAVIIPALIGEGALMLWLIVRGVDKNRF